MGKTAALTSRSIRSARERDGDISAEYGITNVTILKANPAIAICIPVVMILTMLGPHAGDPRRAAAFDCISGDNSRLMTSSDNALDTQTRAC